MRLPKLYKIKKYFNIKFFFRGGYIIKLDKDSEFINSFPKLMDLVFDRKNSDKFNDAYKLQLEMRSIFEDLMKSKEPSKKKTK